MEDDIIIIRVDLTELEGDVNFLFDDQGMQDERLFSLEQETDAIDGQLDVISDEIAGTNPFDPCFVRHGFLLKSLILAKRTVFIIHYRFTGCNCSAGIQSDGFGRKWGKWWQQLGG